MTDLIIRNKRWTLRAFGIIVALAFAVVSIARFASEVSAKPLANEALYSYSVKFVCGEAQDLSEQATVRPGYYGTEINIYNDNLKDVFIEKRVLILVQEHKVIGREPEWVEVVGEDGIDLPPNTATLDDCQRIAEITGVNTGQLTIGYLQLISTMDVAVDAVYTTSDPQDTTPSIDIEQVEPKLLN